jgi:hypothetical protein
MDLALVAGRSVTAHIRRPLQILGTALPLAVARDFAHPEQRRTVRAALIGFQMALMRQKRGHCMKNGANAANV